MRVILSSLLIAASPGLASTATIELQQRPVVVELFTSEGCSSCPPAEVFLGELSRRPDVLALAFHVDYWDDLGWRDTFGIAEATPRQRNYARNLGLSSVYTPQVILEGTGDLVGSDRAGILRALQGSARNGVPIRVSVNDGSVSINLSAGPRAVLGDVALISFARSAVSVIGRGENAGKTLTEYNIARSVKLLGRYDGTPQRYHAEVSGLPRDATDVAVIIQAPGQQAVLGAARCAIR